MEKQLDELVTEFARALRKLAPDAQNVSVSLTIYNTNRIDWNVNIQQAGEDRSGFNKNKLLPGSEPHS